MKTYGIIGHPLGHTMSPVLHNWGFAVHGTKACYKAWPTAPDELVAFMNRFRREHISGLSITIPHKQAVIPLVDRLTNRAKEAGAVNTLWWDKDTLVGDNTDVEGIAGPIQKRRLAPHSALVLGAGGAARAAVTALRRLKVPSVVIANRTRAKAELIAKDFKIAILDWADRRDFKPDLLVNSTPLGMQGKLETRSPLEGELPPGCTVFDLVYNPLETRLLEMARKGGCGVISGIEMFLHQGMEQFRLWTGKELDADKAMILLKEKLG